MRLGTFSRLLVIGLPLLLLASTAGLGAQEPVPLRTGETLSGSVAPGDTLRYSLDTQPEWLVRGEVDQISADVAIRIVRPDGSIRWVEGRGHLEGVLELHATGPPARSASSCAGVSTS
jgi:hypothetical protein